MTRTSLAILLLLALGACTTPLTPPALENRYRDVPEKNAVVSTEIGEALVEQANEVIGPGLRFTSTYEHNTPQVFAPRAQIRIPTSSEFLLSGQHPSNQKHRKYCGQAIDLGSGNLTRPICLIFGDFPSEPLTQFLGESHLNFSDITADYYEEREVRFRSQEAFQRQLIYTGRNGNQIFITYREFENDLARPAFTQKLTFDLGAGKIVGFKGARLEILGASNTNITYRLIQNFQDRERISQ